VRTLVDWLQQHSIVLGLVISLLTMIGVYLGPRLAEKLRQKHERHREHRNRLRQFVIEPIKQRLEEYHLPVLRKERAIVVIAHKVVPKENARLGEVAWIPEQFLAVREPEDEQYAPTDADYYRGAITTSGMSVPLPTQAAGPPTEFGKPEFLWQEARKQFPRFFASWDEFSAAFGDYGRICLQQITQLSRQIAETSQLPEFTPTFPKPPWINAHWLAWYAFFRAVGLAAVRNVEVKAEEKGTGWALVSQHSTTVAEGSKEEVERCLRIADALAETASGKTKLNLQGAALGKVMGLLEEANDCY
jgi:hypothetical protein